MNTISFGNYTGRKGSATATALTLLRKRAGKGVTLVQLMAAIKQQHGRRLGLATSAKQLSAILSRAAGKGAPIATDGHGIWSWITHFTL